MAFPTLGVLDDFNRADGDLGANWSGAPFGSAGEFVVSTNRARRASGNAYTEDYYNVSTYGADCEVYVTAAVKPTGAQYDQFGVTCRIQQPGAGTGDGYKLTVYGDTGDPGVVSGSTQVFRYDNAVGTQLGATIASTLNAGDAFGLEAVGSTLTVYRKPSGGSWGSIGSRTDSTYGAAGYIGMHTYNPSDTGRYDDFGGGTVDGAATEIPHLVMAPPIPA